MTQKERSAKSYRSRKDNGLCPRCGKPLDREGHYCSECLEKVREYQRKNREFYREHHLCTECGKVNVLYSERICPECRAKIRNRKNPTREQKEKWNRGFRNRQKIIYKQRTDAGICTRCGKRKSMPGKKKCGICLAKDAEIHRRRYMDRPNIKEYRKENHLCYFCGNPIDLPAGNNICSVCLKRFKEIAAKRKHDNPNWRKDNEMIFGGGK